jgi:hypothetical protein
MTTLLVCCVGNCFQSPTFAALYNAEAISMGLRNRAISAGLSSRAAVPLTTPFLIEASRQVVPDLKVVTDALRAHRPTPLVSLPYKAVSAGLHLHDAARELRLVAQDERRMQRWFAQGSPATVARVPLDDLGYARWVELKKPTPKSADGKLVIAAYVAQMRSIHDLVRAMLSQGAGVAMTPG